MLGLSVSDALDRGYDADQLDPRAPRGRLDRRLTRRVEHVKARLVLADADRASVDDGRPLAGQGSGGFLEPLGRAERPLADYRFERLE